MSDEIVRFGAFELNLETSELRRNGESLPLERQPARVLTLLASRAGRLVTRDDLRAHIWPEGTHVDFDRGLNYCIRQVRATLEDDARVPRFIETIPRQGYRFVARTEPVRQARLRPRKGNLLHYGASAAGAALLTAAMMALGPTLTDSGQSRHEGHHQAGVVLARTVHDAIFGGSHDTAHHRTAVELLRAVHDLVY
jgi:DNA-binding winged helix-turn-helix (wHTH) protein